jgi:hypothetical protein
MTLSAFLLLTFAIQEGVAERVQSSHKVSLVTSATASPPAPTHADDREAAVASAMATLDALMVAFNDRDMTAWAAALHYPHVRFASGTVRVWPDAESFAAESPFEALAAIGWDRSRWASREVRLMDPDKIHIETVFERLDANDEVLWIFPSLYIVTRDEEGHWGVQARSSLAP